MSYKTQKIKRDPNGKGYMLCETATGIHKFRVDPKVADYIIEHYHNISYDIFSDRYKFFFKDGKLSGSNTTLPRFIYSKFIADKAPNKIKGCVTFKNGLNYDFRTSNLVLKTPSKKSAAAAKKGK